METVLNGLTPEACLVYLDDIIIVGKSFEEHLSNLRRVFEKLKEAKLKLNPSKCNLFRHEVNYLGHIISADGVRTDPQKVSAVKDWRRPKNVHELRSFLGLCTYYRRFVKGFSSIARPLHRLTENKQKFLWTDECEEAFNSLKAALTSSPILVYPDPEKQFILDTDASHESVGAVLSQEINGQEHVIAYWSKCLSKPERNYCVTRKELLAIVKAVENFHSYLYGRKFLLRTDHASLTWLLNFKNTEGQIARWIQKLEEYDFEIKHRKGSLHEGIFLGIYFTSEYLKININLCSQEMAALNFPIFEILTSPSCNSAIKVMGRKKFIRQGNVIKCPTSVFCGLEKPFSFALQRNQNDHCRSWPIKINLLRILI
ncbi:retrovirus-related Pol polyprotein from transposon 17.6 [Trichonephila clavata]|uniref:RNA-directed DNA polymerase n=1 Tax=Trichonephila clavata TaxID=2740835 RepID=A0A8X6H9S7_TRICU|nr:retrovirus-related Pol polyprotein from transposon 17.6 [Trichonephila clavata]